MQEYINFQGTSLLIVTDTNNTKWIAIKPICEAIGIDWKAQHTKIKNDPRINCGDITTVGYDNKQREMTCLPVSQLNGWLFCINANKVKSECRDRLLAYQRECQDVLFRHFMPNGGTNEEIASLLEIIFTLEQTVEKLMFILAPFLESSASAAGTVLEAHRRTKELRKN